MKGNAQPPQRVPVLTEVVVLPKAGAAPGPAAGQVADLAFAATAPAPLSAWAPSGAVPSPPTAPAAPVASVAAVAPIAQPPAVELIDEAAVTQKVLGDLERQLDLMFEHRLRETMAPVLARMTDTLVRELRNQLAATLREMVARSVAQEIERLRRR